MQKIRQYAQATLEIGDKWKLIEKVDQESDNEWKMETAFSAILPYWTRLFSCLINFKLRFVENGKKVFYYEVQSFLTV